jgi:hypothetical protein
MVSMLRRARRKGKRLAVELKVRFPQSLSAMPEQDARKQRILELLNLEDTSVVQLAPSRLRDREASSFVSARVPEPFTLCFSRTRLLHPKTRILTRLVTLISMATLALAVLWRSSPDYRMTVCFVVSAGAICLAVRSFSGGQFILGLLFLGALGVFTPFQSSQFSRALVPVLDMATLALFAASPLLIRKSAPR